jgi:hypothetical protein
VPHGFVREKTFYAAGGFHGIRYRIATADETAAIQRARAQGYASVVVIGGAGMIDATP